MTLAELLPARLAKYARDAHTFPADARAAWTREGLHGVWVEAAHRSVYRLVRWSRSYVIEQDVAAPQTAAVPGIVIEPHTGPWSVLDSLASGRELEVMAMMASRGRTCFVAWRGRRPVGYTWCSDRMEPEIETYPLPLPPDAAYLWNLYVPPVERSGGIGTALAGARLAWAHARGFRRAWRVIRRDNAPSLRTVDKTSGGRARVLGEMRYVKVLDRAFVRYQPYEVIRTGTLASGSPR